MGAVKDTTYYDLLEISPQATDLEIKKSYRKLAIRLHPDKNPNDETAKERFQAVSEAYQVLSNEELRSRYDKFGKEGAVPDSGFEDPSEFFSMIFGGEAFVDLIGEIALMKDLTKTIEITQKHAQENGELEEEEEAAKVDDGSKGKEPIPESTVPGAEKPSASPPPAPAVFPDEKTPLPDEKASLPSENPTSGSGASTPRRGIPTRPMLTEKSHEEHAAEASAAASSSGKGKKKKGGLTKEQMDELEALDAERKKARQERVDVLVRKLIDRLSIWTETDKEQTVTHSFNEKTRLEAENLKMESFGIDILHTIGLIYTTKGQAFIKSQRWLGVPGFFSRLKDKGSQVKETWNTISSAIEAQMTIEEMAKLEEKGGEDWTDEKKAEFERRVTGKILAAAWRGSKMEISSVLREVCDKVLNDPKVPLTKRVERAHALVMVGTIFMAAERDPDDEMAEGVFEALVADASRSKRKDKEKEKEKKGKRGFFSGGRQPSAEDVSVNDAGEGVKGMKI